MNSKETSIFQANMKKAREKKRWSQEGAAKAIGITRPALGSYEEGRAEPSQETQQSICKVYEIDNWISFISDEQYFAPEKAKEDFFHRYNSMPAAIKKAIDTLLKGAY